MILHLTISLMICITVGLLCVKKDFHAVLISGFISGLAAIFYVFNMAPDVGITEAAVGSAISTIFFIITLAVIKKSTNKQVNTDKNIAMLCVFGALMLVLLVIFVYVAIKMPKYGSFGNQIHQGIAAHYIQNTEIDFDIPNMVTAILGGYRGFDTLFETAVIFVSALGVRSILLNNDKQN